MYLDLYLLIVQVQVPVSIGMGSVYVIVYFATYIHWRYMCPCTYSTLYMYCQLQLLQPSGKVESSSVMHMGEGGKRRTS